MGQVVQVNGDYTIKTGEERDITLDTGPGVGNVRVTGNLIVEGDTLTVTAENLNVQDNLIVVNFGETGAGVTLEYAGLEVDRGSLPNALFLFDEAADSWIIGQGSVVGSISYTDSSLKLRKILTDPDTDEGDLTLIGTGLGVIKVLGTQNYEQQVTDDDDIPNKAYVDNAIQSNPTYQIVRGDTRVISFDKDAPLDPGLNFPPAIGPYVNQPADSIVSIVVDGLINSVFYNNRAVIQGIEINDTEITNDNTNSNIFIRTNGTGKLQTNYAVQLDKIGVTPAAVGDAVLIYAAEPSIATTGVYFTNNQRSGELINKNKALLFSMIF